mgnify:CR=1 FL=1
MKSIIPFTKELDFKTKVSEITSISLEREFEVNTSSIEGSLYVSGDYKSHEVSANVTPFNFKIPFTIEIPDNLVEESITLEISDFAYEMEENSKIKVSIELELFGEEKEIEEEEDEDITPIEVDGEEIVKMLEEASEKEKEMEKEDRAEPKEEPTEEEKEEAPADTVDETREETEDMTSENVIITGASNTPDEYTTYHIHIVKEGETIETICTMYNSNLSLLNDYNDLSEVSKGMKIIIPENDES